MHQFNVAKLGNSERSKFDLSHSMKTTFDSGKLIPFFVEEVLPGDTHILKTTNFIRLATPLKPFMDNLYVDTFYFFVPNRLTWENSEKFYTGGDDTGEPVEKLTPKHISPDSGWKIASAFDYFGIPLDKAKLKCVAFYYRSIQLIWNEWFRDQNLQEKIVIDKSDADAEIVGDLLPRGKRHDYFTSCLPWTQKGPAVSLPLGTFAPVVSNGVAPNFSTNIFSNIPIRAVNTTPSGLGNTVFGTNLTVAQASTNAIFGNQTGLQTDLSSSTSVTINALRQAIMLQQYFELNARGGTRYTEWTKAHFKVSNPDFRLQRPEYLGGSTETIMAKPVANTATTLGDLGAFAVSTGQSGFSKSFTEHGVIIGLMAVRADLSYQQGINRKFSRDTKFDYYMPAFKHLGEQAVLNKEIYAQGFGNSEDDEVFGYQERWAEYRYSPSLITGKMRSANSGASWTSLDIWHLAQNFINLPVLNFEFIEDKPPVNRVIVATEEPQFIGDFYFSHYAVRELPVYSVPGLGNKF